MRREHAEEDDKKLEQLHLNAAQGKLRAKRKGLGLDFDDSDSEDELAEQAHLYRSKTSIESSSGSMVWANSRQWLPRRVNRLYRRRAPPAPFQR